MLHKFDFRCLLAGNMHLQQNQEITIIFKLGISNFEVQTVHDVFLRSLYSRVIPVTFKCPKNTAQLEFRFIRPLHIFTIHKSVCVCVYAVCMARIYENSFNRTNLVSIEIYSPLNVVWINFHVVFLRFSQISSLNFILMLEIVALCNNVFCTVASNIMRLLMPNVDRI